MRRSRVALALLVLIAVAANAQAFTLPEWEHYGDPVPLYDARALAMGGAGLASADGTRGAALNPALVSKVEGIELAVTGLVVVAEEARETPLHDSFDGVIGYNTYALNTDVYDRYVGTIAFKPGPETRLFEEWSDVMPAVAIGYGPRLDMSYDYHVQYRDPDFQTEPNDKILYDYYINGDGGIAAFSVALGQEVLTDVHVGLGVDFLRGQYDVSERWVYPPGSEEEDTSARAEYEDVSGTQFVIGALVERLHRVDVALVYRFPFTLGGEAKVRPVGAEEAVSEDFEYEYPGTFGLGLEYHPRNMIMTTVSADIEFTAWSNLKDDRLDDSPDLEDTFTYRVGVEHSFFDNTLARFGFTYRPSYVETAGTQTAFSAGLGLDVLGVRVDIGGQVGLRDYDIDDGRVRETTTLAMATIVKAF